MFATLSVLDLSHRAFVLRKILCDVLSVLSNEILEPNAKYWQTLSVELIARAYSFGQF